MKQMLFLFFLSLLLLTGSCKKNKNSGPTTASGYIADASNGHAVPYADVWLLQGSQSLFSPDSDIVYQRADAQGRFSFSFNANENTTYSIASRSPFYFDNEGSGTINPGLKNEGLVIKMDPKGWIKFNVVNEPPLDTLSGLDLPDCQTIYFLFKDTSVVAEELGNNQRDFVWLFRKKGEPTWEKNSDKIFVPDLDTVEYTIKY